MALDTKTYDPKLVVVTFCGLTLTGMAEGTFINFKPAGPSFKTKRGNDGTVERTNTNIRNWTGDILFNQTSDSNGDLSVIHEADKLGNTGKGPLEIKDLGGTTQFYALDAWIEQGPDLSFADDTSPRTWKFTTGPVEAFVGGN